MTLRAYVRTRVAAIMEAGYAHDLTMAWPADVPGLKAEGHTDAQLDLILAACVVVAGRHRLPFAEVSDPRVEPLRADLADLLAGLDVTGRERHAYWNAEAETAGVDLRQHKATTLPAVWRALAVATLCRLDIATASKLLFDTNPRAMEAPFDRTDAWLVQQIDTEQAQRICAAVQQETTNQQPQTKEHSNA